MDLKPKDPGLIPLSTLDRDQSRVDLQKDVVERGAEVGAVDGGVARGLRVVHVFAFGAVEFYRFDVGVVGLPHGEEGVAVAGDAGTFAEVGFFVFLELGGLLAVIER